MFLKEHITTPEQEVGPVLTSTRSPCKDKTHPHTFSVSRLVIWSRRFWVKTMEKTACDLDDVSFMFVAATVL